MPEWGHGDKEVRRALDDAATAGFRVTPSPNTHGHSWGYIDCTQPDCGGRFYVWSTPAVAAVFAKKIRSFIRRHDHKEE